MCIRDRDEYEGQVALSKLINQLNPEEIQGRVIILPMANFPAAKAGLRTSPIDEQNLNRSYPGDPDGSPSFMIARYIESQLLSISDYCLDLHSGGSSLHYVPSAVSAVVEDKDCLLYTSDAADDSLRVDLGGRRIIKKML